MLTDEQLGEALGRELSELTDDMTPRPGLADRAIAARRGRRRRIQAAAGGGVAVAAAVTAAVVVGTGGSNTATRLGSRTAQLASYRFALPRDTTGVAASAADCALRATVVFPYATSTAQIGASDPSQPAVASAILGDGGCVSMLLTDPYTPGGAGQPVPAFPVLDSSSVSIAGDQGTIGTYEFMGDATNGNGVSLNGAKNVELTLQVPTANNQMQMLLVAAAGVDESELQSIVASGLTTP